MSKLNELKEKLAQTQAQMAEKADKIPLVQKWKAKRAEAAAKGPDPLALGTMYKSGGVGIRLQVLVVVVLGAAAVYLSFSAAGKVLHRLRPEKAHEDLAHQVSHGLEEVQHHAVEEAKVVALGKFNANTFGGPQGEAIVNMDVWLRVSNPTVAGYVEKNVDKFTDLAMSTINAAYHEKVDVLTDEGKTKLKIQLNDSLSKALPEGKIEEIFFHNLVVQ
jgi:flagellar basal body-associated protein FliL